MIKLQRPIGLKIVITLELLGVSVILVQFLGLIAILFGHNANAIGWLRKIGVLQLYQLLQNDHSALNFFIFFTVSVIFIKLVIINELYNFKRWVWMIELILTGYGLFYQLSVLIHRKFSNQTEFLSTIITIIVGAIIIYCLMIPSTRQAFRNRVKAN